MYVAFGGSAVGVSEKTACRLESVSSSSISVFWNFVLQSLGEILPGMPGITVSQKRFQGPKGPVKGTFLGEKVFRSGVVKLMRTPAGESVCEGTARVALSPPPCPSGEQRNSAEKVDPTPPANPFPSLRVRSWVVDDQRTGNWTSDSEEKADESESSNDSEFSGSSSPGLVHEGSGCGGNSI